MKTTTTTPTAANSRPERLEILIGGKVRPMLFDVSFFEILTRNTSLVDMEEMATTRPWRVVPTLAAAALQAAAEFENKKDKFTYEQLAPWVAEIEDADTLKPIVDTYKANVLFFFQSIHGKPQQAAESQE